MPSEAANRWWGETEKMEAGQYKAVSLKKKKNYPVSEQEEEEQSMCGQRAHE